MNSELGIVGLGKMGENLSLNALEKKLRVVGYDLKEPSPKLLKAGLEFAHSLEELKAKLSPPRTLFLYVPAGPAVDQLIDQLSQLLEAGDLLVDGGNSYWGDSKRRCERLRQRKIAFVDLGTSGGTSGARHGACFMAGGDEESFQRFLRLSLPKQ